MKIRITVKSRAPLNDFFLSGPLLIVSETLKGVLELADANCEFIEVAVSPKARSGKRTFFFCNTLECIDCIDHKRGKYTFWDEPRFRDRVKTIRKLAINDAKARGHGLFRLSKGGEFIVCASESLARRVATQDARELTL